MPPGLSQALGPVLEQIAAMTMKIKQYDRQIQELGQAKYPETQALLKVHGVGHITALTFVLTLGSKGRFKQSRDVGCYLGLRPRRSQSGDRGPQPKPFDRVFQPYPASAWTRLIASTVGTPSGFARRQAGKEQGGCRGSEEVGCTSPSHLDDARAVHALLRTSCLRNNYVHPFR
jgi:transposase